MAANPAEDMNDADAEAALQRLMGPMGDPHSTIVELGAVRRMALAIEDHDPIHFDDAAARERGYRGVVAPWPLLWLYFFTCTRYDFDIPFGRATVHGQDDYEFHEPIIVGDELTVSTAIVDVKLKHGRSGRLGQVVAERRFVNQRGQLCAVLKTTLMRR